MLIKGLQKLTLIDYPEKITCTIFLSGCNFRCGYCHNPELVIGENKIKYSEEEILDFLENRKKYLEGVCITGGEPLLDIRIDFLKKIKSLNYLIKIDTNGSFPGKLKEIINKGLVDYIAMDIKGNKEKYKEIVNSFVDLDKIEESIRIVSNFPNYEFRTTILERYHGEKEIIEMTEWIKRITGSNEHRYYLQPFIPQKGKLIDSKFEKFSETPTEHLERCLEKTKDYLPNARIRGQ
jgi:pyruvate formate lyase activating enzyme